MRLSEMYPKAWERLEKLNALREGAQALEYEAKSLENAATRTTRRYANANVRVSREPDAILVSAANARAEAEDARRRLNALINATNAYLRRLDRPLHRALLICLYTEGLRPCEVRRAFGYSESGYYRALCGALGNLENLMAPSRAGDASA